MSKLKEKAAHALGYVKSFFTKKRYYGGYCACAAIGNGLLSGALLSDGSYVGGALLAVGSALFFAEAVASAYPEKKSEAVNAAENGKTKTDVFSYKDSDLWKSSGCPKIKDSDDIPKFDSMRFCYYNKKFEVI